MLSNLVDNPPSSVDERNERSIDAKSLKSVLFVTTRTSPVSAETWVRVDDDTEAGFVPKEKRQTKNKDTSHSVSDERWPSVPKVEH